MTKHTYWVSPVNTEDKNKYKHPTCKPVPIIKNLLQNSSREGSIVLDPFMGSGSTGVACVELKRCFIGIELDTGYFETAKNRIEGTELLYE